MDVDEINIFERIAQALERIDAHLGAMRHDLEGLRGAVAESNYGAAICNGLDRITTALSRMSR